MDQLRILNLLLLLMYFNEKQTENQNVGKLRQIVSIIQNQVNGGLQEIKQWGKIGPMPQQAIILIINYMAITIPIPHPKNPFNLMQFRNYSEISYFALISPSLHDNRNKTIKIQLVKCKFGLRIGLAWKWRTIQSNFSGNGDMYLVHYEGYISCKPSPNIEEENSGQCSFREGHVLELEYSKIEKTLKITNLNGGCLVLRGIGNENKDLHYCVEVKDQCDSQTIM